MTLRSLLSAVPRPGPTRRPPARCAAAVAGALVTLVALGGCGGTGSPDARGPTTLSPTATAAPTTPPPAPSASPTSSTGRPPRALPSPKPMPSDRLTIVVDGIAKPGVEPGCTVLSAVDGRTWLLLGVNGGTPDQKEIPLNVPVRVHGVQLDNVVSYCQQGIPLEVVDVARR